MSPRGRERTLSLLRFPRVSGDEPVVMNLNPIGLMFSPRERG